jgi:hypothetical protein
MGNVFRRLQTSFAWLASHIDIQNPYIPFFETLNLLANGKDFSSHFMAGDMGQGRNGRRNLSLLYLEICLADATRLYLKKDFIFIGCDSQNLRFHIVESPFQAPVSP